MFLHNDGGVPRTSNEVYAKNRILVTLNQLAKPAMLRRWHLESLLTCLTEQIGIHTKQKSCIFYKVKSYIDWANTEKTTNKNHWQTSKSFIHTHQFINELNGKPWCCSNKWKSCNFFIIAKDREQFKSRENTIIE